ncbi:TetR/AcrR family transcriptional regulator, partial [Singulisphaera rosea]
MVSDEVGKDPSVRKTTARDRVLEVATDLFYREGIRAVGIDTIIARSGVAKMSLYRNFASKDELIVAFVERRNDLFFEWWDRVMRRDEGRPRDQLRNLIPATLKKVVRPDYRGCPFLNTTAEFPEASHPARVIIAAHKQEVRSRLMTLSDRSGAANPQSLTEQWIVLMDGIYANPTNFTDPAAAAAIVA